MAGPQDAPPRGRSRSLQRPASRPTSYPPANTPSVAPSDRLRPYGKHYKERPHSVERSNALVAYSPYGQNAGQDDPRYARRVNTSNSSSEYVRPPQRLRDAPLEPSDDYERPPRIPPPPRSEVSSVVTRSMVSFQQPVPTEVPPEPPHQLTRKELAERICHLYPILRWLLIYTGIFVSVNNFVFGVINYITDESWEVSTYASVTRYLFPWWMMFLSIGTGYAEFWRVPGTAMLPCDATCGNKFRPPVLIWQRSSRGMCYIFVGALMTDYGYLSVLSGFLSAALGAFNIAFAIWGWWQEWDCQSCLTGRMDEDDVEAQVPPPVEPVYYSEQEEYYDEPPPDPITVVRSWKTSPPLIEYPEPVPQTYSRGSSSVSLTKPAAAATPAPATTSGKQRQAPAPEPVAAPPSRPPIAIRTSSRALPPPDESSSTSSSHPPPPPAPAPAVPPSVPAPPAPRQKGSRTTAAAAVPASASAAPPPSAAAAAAPAAPRQQPTTVAAAAAVAPTPASAPPAATTIPSRRPRPGPPSPSPAPEPATTIPSKHKGRPPLTMATSPAPAPAADPLLGSPPPPAKPAAAGTPTALQLASPSTPPPPAAAPAPATTSSIPSKRMQPRAKAAPMPADAEDWLRPQLDPRARAQSPALLSAHSNHFEAVDGDQRQVKDKRHLLVDRDASGDSDSGSIRSAAEALGLHGRLGPAVAQPPPQSRHHHSGPDGLPRPAAAPAPAAGAPPLPRRPAPRPQPPAAAAAAQSEEAGAAASRKAAAVKHKLMKMWGHARGQQTLKDFGAQPEYRLPDPFAAALPHPDAPAFVTVTAPSLPSLPSPDHRGRSAPPGPLRGPSLSPPPPPELPRKEVKENRKFLPSPESSDGEDVLSVASASEAMGLHGQMGPAIAEMPLPRPTCEAITLHDLDLAAGAEADDDQFLVDLGAGDEPAAPAPLAIPPPPPPPRRTSKGPDPKRKGFKKGFGLKGHQSLLD